MLDIENLNTEDDESAEGTAKMALEAKKRQGNDKLMQSAFSIIGGEVTGSKVGLNLNANYNTSPVNAEIRTSPVNYNANFGVNAGARTDLGFNAEVRT